MMRHYVNGEVCTSERCAHPEIDESASMTGSSKPLTQQGRSELLATIDRLRVELAAVTEHRDMCNAEVVRLRAIEPNVVRAEVTRCGDCPLHGWDAGRREVYCDSPIGRVVTRSAHAVPVDCPLREHALLIALDRGAR